jgi:hypothetical protein
MPDDAVTASWKRLTDRVKETSRAAVRRTTTSAVALEKLAVAMFHADSMKGAAPSSPPAHAESATAGDRADRDGEAIRHATPLATWEDEGGATSSGLEAPLRKS